MRRWWWTYTYEPVERHVTVIRWTQTGNLRPAISETYERLTWSEAQDVMELDAWALLDRLRRSETELG